LVSLAWAFFMASVSKHFWSFGGVIAGVILIESIRGSRDGEGLGWEEGHTAHLA